MVKNSKQQLVTVPPVFIKTPKKNYGKRIPVTSARETPVKRAVSVERATYLDAKKSHRAERRALRRDIRRLHLLTLQAFINYLIER